MKTILLLAAISAQLLSVAAHAVPLFGESAGTIREGILTLHKDDQNPNKVYFFPNSTRISLDNNGVPLFNFVYWGINSPDVANPPGAYMTLSSHLTPDKDQQRALDRYIESHPEMEVAVLPIKSSMIGLQTTVPNEQPLKALFTEFNFARAGGRAEDEIGINAVLTPIGARAFKALLKKEMGGQKLKFDYCYVTQGFGPNMNATVTVNMRRVYEYFEANHSGGWGWFAWDIKSVVEKLNASNDIRIVMNGGDAEMWEVLQTVAAQITSRLFKPELSASPVSPASPNRIFNFGVSSVRRDELKVETWTYVRRDLEEREFCTAVSVKDLDGHLDKLVISAD